MPRIFAHRGLSGIAPENTLAAIKMCAEHGVTWFETDVDIIGNGTPVLLHDTALDRTTNRSGSMYDLTQDDLATVDAGAWFGKEFAGERVPTLAQLVDVMNERKLNVNLEIKSNEQGAIKTYQLIDAVIAELARLDEDREVLVSSFNHLLLAEFKRRAPHYKTAALYTADTLLPDWLSVLELAGASAIHLDNTGLTSSTVRQAKQAGIEVNVYTVNSRARANELFNWGVDGIFTDYAHTFIDLEQ